VYFDTAYILKFYLDDLDAPLLHGIVEEAEAIRSSFWSFTEFHSALHRRVREKSMDAQITREIAAAFRKHVDDKLWNLIPVNEALLRSTGMAVLAAPTGLFLRAGDALHLTTARDAGETEIWTSDRHMLAAAPYFGLQGRSI
jgi:predicted nucleic acid-binding protein